MHAPTRRWTVPVGLLALAVGALSQEVRAQDADAVGAENIARFAGNWTFDQIDGEPANGQAGCNMLGDYIVWCRSAVVNDDGTENGLLFSVRYDTVEDAYWGYRFYDNGYADAGRGWVDGNDWTFVYPLPDGSLARFSGTFTSDDTWEYAWHLSEQGGDWVAGQTGLMTKR